MFSNRKHRTYPGCNDVARVGFKLRQNNHCLSGELVMLQIWKEQKNCIPFRIYRRNIVKRTSIKSIITYETYIRELKDRGKVEYRPYKHPMLGSEVILI